MHKYIVRGFNSAQDTRFNIILTYQNSHLRRYTPVVYVFSLRICGGMCSNTDRFRSESATEYSAYIYMISCACWWGGFTSLACVYMISTGAWWWGGLLVWLTNGWQTWPISQYNRTRKLTCMYWCKPLTMTCVLNSQVLEIRPSIEWDKGNALEFLLASLGEHIYMLYIYITHAVLNMSSSC